MLVGILGLYETGKSYIISKLSNRNIKLGFDERTIGFNLLQSKTDSNI